MIYVEYISPRADVPLADFHRAAGEAPLRWDASHGEDRLIWNAARTWRLGPSPAYLTVWHSPASGLERLDEWDRLFRGGGQDEHEREFAFAAKIEAAGCYEPLREPVAMRDGLYYAEFFRPAGSDQAIATFFGERARRHTAFTLGLLVRRIGYLGPEPGGLAVWAVPDFTALAQIADDLTGIGDPIAGVAAGAYVDIGREIL
jgi:hypothetical protein